MVIRKGTGQQFFTTNIFSKEENDLVRIMSFIFFSYLMGWTFVERRTKVAQVKLGAQIY